MSQLDHLGCIEACVRDTHPGKIRVDNRGKIQIEKTLNQEDRKRKARGLQTIKDIFNSVGAKDIIEGSLGIGLHLMGGCPLGENPQEGVINHQFQTFIDEKIYICDASVFPSAPGINPSLTIMALSLMGSEQMKRDMPL